MFALKQKSPQQEQAHQLISTLRKALTQQKQLEESCERARLPIDYRWSLNSASLETLASPMLPLDEESKYLSP